jgi:hypothetical protein
MSAAMKNRDQQKSETDVVMPGARPMLRYRQASTYFIIAILLMIYFYISYNGSHVYSTRPLQTLFWRCDHTCCNLNFPSFICSHDAPSALAAHQTGGNSHWHPWRRNEARILYFDVARSEFYDSKGTWRPAWTGKLG